MNFLQIVRHGGIGGGLLAGYLVLFIRWTSESIPESEAYLYAIITTLVIVLVISLLTDHISVLLAWDIIGETHNHIREEVGEEQFYYDHENKQDNLDDEDNKILNISILLTLIIITLPTAFYLLLSEYGQRGFLMFLPLFIFLLIIARFLILRARKIIRLSRRYYGR